MPYSHPFSKAAELGIVFTATLALILAGCGGGSSSGTTASVAPATVGSPAAGSPLANFLEAQIGTGTRNAHYLEPYSSGYAYPDTGYAKIYSWGTSTTPNIYTLNDGVLLGYVAASGIAPVSWTPASAPSSATRLANSTTHFLNTDGWTTTNTATTYTDGTVKIQGLRYGITEEDLTGVALGGHLAAINSMAAALPGVFPAGAKTWQLISPYTTTVDQYTANTSIANNITTAAGIVPFGLTLAIAQTFNTTLSPLCAGGRGFVYQAPSTTTVGAGRFGYYTLTPMPATPAGAALDCTNSTIATGAWPAGAIDMQQLTVNGATVLKFTNEVSAAGANTNAYMVNENLSSASRASGILTSRPTWSGNTKVTTAAVCLPAPVAKCTLGRIELTGSDYSLIASPYYKDFNQYRTYNKTAMDAMMTAMGWSLF